MEPFIIFLVIILFTVVPIAFFVGLIYFIYKSSKKSKSVQYNTDAFISRLKEYNSKGYRTIDQVIKYEQDETLLNTSESQLIQEKPKENITENIEAVKLHSTNKSNANIILYLGSFLVTFAMMALVTLGWNTIPDTLKVTMLVINLLGFLISGFAFINNVKLRRVGVTFLTVSSLGYFLLTLGIWNFVLIKHIPDYFNLYWLITSISGLVINLMIMKVLNERRFFYLLLFSIYSIIFSSSFTITNETNVRVVMVLIMNLILYLSSYLFGGYNKSIVRVSGILNIIGNIIIFFIVLFSINSITSNLNIFLSSVSLIIPLVYIVIAYIKDKNSFYYCIELFLFIFKALLLLKIFSVSSDITLITISLICFIYVFCAYSIFSIKSKAIYYVSQIVSYSTLLMLSLVLFLLIFINQATYITIFTTSTILVISQLTFLLIPILKKNYNQIGIALVYLLMIFSMMIKLSGITSTIELYTYILLGLGLVTGLVRLVLSQRNEKNIEMTIQPISIVSTIVSLILSTFGFPLVMSVALGLVSVYLLIRSVVTKSMFQRILTNLSFVFFCLIFVQQLININLFETSLSYSYLFLIPVLILWLFIDFISNDRSIPEKISMLSLFVFGLLFYTHLDVLAVLIFFIVLLGISLYRAMKFKTNRYLASSVLLLNITSIYALSYYKINTENILAILTGINSVISVISMSLYIKTLESRKGKVLSNTSLLLNVLLFFVCIIYSIVVPKLQILSSAYLFIFITMILKQNKVVKQLSGIPVLFALWNIFSIYNITFQYNIVIITIYLLILAFVNYKKERISTAKALEITAYLLQLSSLFINARLGSTEQEKIVIGIILIVLSSGLFLYGINTHKKYLWIIALIYLFIELFAQLILVINVIPWWIYVAVIGVVMILIAIYQMRREK